MNSMGKWMNAVFGLAVPVVFLAGWASSDQFQVSPRAKALHAAAIVLDTHDDTTQRLIYENFDLSKRHPDGHIDIARMREGAAAGTTPASSARRSGGSVSRSRPGSCPLSVGRRSSTTSTVR
jgi:hypothetical protein